MTTEITMAATKDEAKETGSDVCKTKVKEAGLESAENKIKEAIPDAAKDDVEEAGSDSTEKAETKLEGNSVTPKETKEEANGSDDELKNSPSKEQFDELTIRSKKLENILNIQIKTLCEKTDVSAFNKVNMVLEIIKASQPKEEKEETEGKRETNKRSADDSSEQPKNKCSKPEEKKENKEGEMKKGKDDGEDSDEEGHVDSCVVCGLYLSVFKEDSSKELHHYLSHGFNILKEFDILKPDDSIFLLCNLCGSPFPKKCHVNFRKHLVAEHEQKIIEIFREI